VVSVPIVSEDREVECGFDAHHRDPLGRQRLTSQGYYQMAERLLALRPTGIVFTLEEGYDVGTSTSWPAHLLGGR
jgi:acetoin utilization deacetylase AcuC-like enzyme